MDAEILASNAHSLECFVHLQLAHSMLCNFSYWCMTKVITNVWPIYHFRVKQ